MKITKEEIEIEPMKEGDNEFVWMLKAYGEVLKNTPELLKKFYIDPLIALGKATIRRPILVNPSGKRTRLKTKDSRWLFDDPKYGTAGQGYLPIWHYIPRKGFVDAHEGAKYYGLLDGVNAVDQDVLDKSNRDLQNIIRALQKRREKRVQKENKTMKITKEELANIIKEEVEKATISEQTTYSQKINDALKSLDAAEQSFRQAKSANDLAKVMPIVFDSIRHVLTAVALQKMPKSE
jgi:hypothetical protein